MEFCRSAGLFILGVVKRFYLWLPAIVLDPFDLNDKVVQPMMPESLKFSIPWSPDWSGAVLLVLIGWAAIWTYHEARVLSLKDDLQPTDSVRWLFQYMLTDSNWVVGRGVTPNDDHVSGGKLYRDLQAELRDAARLGKLFVWGRPKEGGPWKPPLVKFDAARWDHLQFDLPSCMGLGGSAELSEWPPGQLNWSYFEDAQINRAQVLQIWSKAPCWKRFRDKSRDSRIPFVRKETSDQMNVAW